jgi:RNA polymerase sigma factor (sigma-70 family)
VLGDSSFQRVAPLRPEKDPPHVSEILCGLASRSPRSAWELFLDDYSPVILQVVRLFESGQDEVSDCFLFVCEELSRNNFRRLRRFEERGVASFATWLRVVVRRLCVDWHRRECGRTRVFASIARLSAQDKVVFEALYTLRIPEDAAWLHVSASFPEVTKDQFSNSCARLRESLTPRQRWLMSTRQPRLESLDAIMANAEVSLHDLLPDPAPDPETLASGKELRAKLDHALADLAAPDRLLIRLRFEHGLTLQQAAALTGLHDPQTTDRRLRQILAVLRDAMGKKAGRVRVEKVVSHEP